MYDNKEISVVLSTYRERGSIRRVIEDFFASGYVDEVVVVNNNAEAGTDEEVLKTKARLVYEKRQGYGHGFRKGLSEARGDIIVMCDPDGSFNGREIERLLVYARDFPIVLGSRTNRSTILDEVNPLRRFGNVVCAKFIEILFLSTTITDIGCTYRLLSREALSKIEGQLKQNNPLLVVEMVLLAATEHIPFIEVPVTFRPRVGKSQIVSHWYQWVYWGIRIGIYIIAFWVNDLRRKML